MKIQGIGASSHLDSSGEILEVSGANIDDLHSGGAVLNWEHSDSSEDQIGIITYAKKIFTEADCDLPVQKKYLAKLKKPFIYFTAQLLDDDGNVGAIAVASMVRYCIKNNIPLNIGFSVQGSTLDRDINILKQSLIRKISATLKPCNKTCIAEALDPETESMLAKLGKSESSEYDIDINDFTIEDPVQSIQSDVKSFIKSITPIDSIYIIRHGATEFNGDAHSDDRIRGWIDVPLNEKGIKEAHDLADKLKKENIDIIYASDLGRAKQTAEIIAKASNIPVIVDPKFRPWNLGEYQGQKTKDVIDKLNEMIEKGDTVPKGGESFNDFKARYLGELEKLIELSKKENKRVAVVAHYRNLKTAKAWFNHGHKSDLSLDPIEMKRDDINTGSAIKLNFNKDKIEDIKKDLTAGMGNVAPSALVGGAALSVEDSGLKQKIKDIVFKWDKKRPLRQVIKAALPELSDEYVNYFADLNDDLALKKGEAKPQRISANDSQNPLMNEDQRKLIEGLYMYPEHNLSVNKTTRLTNDSGDDILLQAPKDDSHKQQAAYSFLAKDFFDLGDNVPTTNYFMHKSNPLQYVVARKKLDGKPSLLSDGYERAIEQSKKDDNFQKLFLMDLITGTHRCYHNIVTDSGNKIYFIDNKAFNYDKDNGHVFLKDTKDDLLNLSTKEWLKKLDSRKLAKYMQLLGFDIKDIQQAAYRLKAVQGLGNANKTISHIYSILNKPTGVNNESL